MPSTRSPRSRPASYQNGVPPGIRGLGDDPAGRRPPARGSRRADSAARELARRALLRPGAGEEGIELGLGERLIEAGFGLALLPESSVREERNSGSLATIEVADLRASNPVFAIVRKGGDLSPATEARLTRLAPQPPAPDGKDTRPQRRRRRRR